MSQLNLNKLDWGSDSTLLSHIELFFIWEERQKGIVREFVGLGFEKEGLLD